MSGATGAAIGVVGASAIGSTVAGFAQAGAAQDAASMQYSAAIQQINAESQANAANLQFATQSRDLQIQARSQAVQLAAPSGAELQQMGTNLALQNQALVAETQGLQRNQDILNSVDPSIKQAGQQALQLLQGKQAQAVQPFLDQRNLQRNKLEQTLADKLGPDYATSSAGAQALRAFDSDTSMQTNQVQQQTLAELLGVSQNASTQLNPVNNAAAAYSTLGSLNAVGIQAAQNQVGRQVNAFTGNPVTQQLNSQAPNFNNLYQAAGNSTIGSVLGAQAVGNAFNQLGGIGGQFLGSQLSGGGSGGLTNAQFNNELGAYANVPIPSAP